MSYLIGDCMSHYNGLCYTDIPSFYVEEETIHVTKSVVLYQYKSVNFAIIAFNTATRTLRSIPH